MSGYVHFTPTGVEAIDAILAAMTRAGNMFHHTGQWQDPYPTDDDPSPLDRIQQAANDAAKALAPATAAEAAPSGDVERVVRAAGAVWDHPAFRPHRDGYLDLSDDELTPDAIDWRDTLRALDAALRGAPAASGEGKP